MIVADEQPVMNGWFPIKIVTLRCINTKYPVACI